MSDSAIPSAKRVLLHAPNVHSGGGGGLLKVLMGSSDQPFSWLQLDCRIQEGVATIPPGRVSWVRHSLVARLAAEWRLNRQSRPGDVILCFHGLPPLFTVRGKVVVFVQNRLLLEDFPLGQFPWKTALRIWLERCWIRRRMRLAMTVVVQTDSMARLVKQRVGHQFQVLVRPFVGNVEESSTDISLPQKKRYDFVYVATGDSHKNHKKLLEAWCILAAEGISPSLALTVDGRRYPDLVEDIEQMCKTGLLNINNLGWLDEREVSYLYRSATALIFPSKVESFGLPLLEAAGIGLPILAAELDYVRDVVEPVETFDPDSSLSIARAVKRFLKLPSALAKVGGVADFIEVVQNIG